MLYFEVVDIKTGITTGTYNDVEDAIDVRKAKEYIRTVDGTEGWTMKDRMENLDDKLRHYSEYYYKNNVSLIDDGTYDKLMKRLEEWEKEYPEYKNENSMASKVGSSL